MCLQLHSLRFVSGSFYSPESAYGGCKEKAGNFGRVCTVDRSHRLSGMVCGADPTTPPTLIVWVAQVVVLRDLCS